MRLLLTRQPAQAGPLEGALAGADVGGEPLELGFLPLTDFALPADGDALRGMSRQLVAPAAGVLVVTSPNVVRALRAHDLSGVGEGVRAAATGPGTARALAAAAPGIRIWTPPHDRSAEGILAGMTGPDADPGLLEGLPAARPGAAVDSPRPVAWLPQSDRARPLLAEGLRAAGWDVRTAAAYETVPYPAPRGRRLLEVQAGGTRLRERAAPSAATLRSGVVTPEELPRAEPGTAVLLTSSSAAEAFAAEGLRETARERLRLVAIGEPTRRTALGLHLPLAGTCATPDALGVLTVLRSLPA